ncbi:MAG: hypothetical protein OSJ66_07250 [Clostridia bacterium]|nr:hypothetical protein [Clostridia bacterium]
MTMEKAKMITKEERELERYSINIEKLAKQLLKDMGIKLHYLGFEYWVKTILITIKMELNNESKPKMMTVYYRVAKRFDTTASKVERAMRYTYEGLDLNNYFNVAYKINNTALLFLLKDKILEEIKTMP